jgi:hypothetical protein
VFRGSYLGFSASCQNGEMQCATGAVTLMLFVYDDLGVLLASHVLLEDGWYFSFQMAPAAENSKTS